MTVSPVYAGYAILMEAKQLLVQLREVDLRCRISKLSYFRGATIAPQKRDPRQGKAASAYDRREY